MIITIAGAWHRRNGDDTYDVLRSSLVCAIRTVPRPSVEGGITLGNLEVDRNATFGEYLQWPGTPAKVRVCEVSEEGRQRLRSIIRFVIELKGLGVFRKSSIADGEKNNGGL
jgi:hypothetical protein